MTPQCSHYNCRTKSTYMVSTLLHKHSNIDVLLEKFACQHHLEEVCAKFKSRANKHINGPKRITTYILQPFATEDIE